MNATISKNDAVAKAMTKCEKAELVFNAANQAVIDAERALVLAREAIEQHSFHISMATLIGARRRPLTPVRLAAAAAVVLAITPKRRLLSSGRSTASSGSLVRV